MKRHGVLKVFDWHEYNAEAENCRAMAERIARLGREVAIVCSEREPCLSRMRGWGGETIAVSGLGSKRNPLAWARSVNAIVEIARRRGVSILHPYRSSVHSLCAFAARRLPGVRLVRTRATDDPPKRSSVNGLLYSRLTDATIVSSERIARRFVEFGLAPKTNVHVVYGGVDLRPFTPLPPREAWRKRLGVSSSEVLVVMLARLAPIKGHEYALRALSAIIERFSNARLVCVGVPWGDALERLRALAGSLGVGNNVLFIPKFVDDVPGLLAAADVGLLASIGSEGMSRACLEYMAASLPVVATTVGVIPEVVGGETGLLVPPCDSDALSNALASMVGRGEARRSMGDAGRRRVEGTFTLDREAEAVLAVYDRVARRDPR